MNEILKEVEALIERMRNTTDIPADYRPRLGDNIRDFEFAVYRMRKMLDEISYFESFVNE